MSIRADTASLIPGSIVCGVPGLGILGSVILATTGEGGSGPGILFNDVQAGDEAKEFRAEVLSWPTTGALNIAENGTFTYSGATAGEFTYRGYADGVSYGAAEVSLYDATFDGAFTPASLVVRPVLGSSIAWAYSPPAPVEYGFTPASVAVSATFGPSVWNYTAPVPLQYQFSGGSALIGVGAGGVMFAYTPAPVIEYEFSPALIDVPVLVQGAPLEFSEQLPMYVFEALGVGAVIGAGSVDWTYFEPALSDDDLVTIDEARMHIRTDSEADDMWLYVWIPIVSDSVRSWLKDPWRPYELVTDEGGAVLTGENGFPIPKRGANGQMLVKRRVKGAVLVELAQQYRFRDGSGAAAAPSHWGHGHVLGAGATSLLASTRKGTVV